MSGELKEKSIQRVAYREETRESERERDEIKRKGELSFKHSEFYDKTLINISKYCLCLLMFTLSYLCKKNCLT